MASKWVLNASEILIGAKVNGNPQNLIMVQVSTSPKGEQSVRMCQGWDDEGETKPTRKGFNIKMEDIPELKKCLTRVMNAAK